VNRRVFLKRAVTCGAVFAAGGIVSTGPGGCARSLRYRVQTSSAAGLPVHRIKTAFTNSYLIRGPEGFLLIDTGYWKDYDAFREALRHLDVDPAQISDLLLTHHHDDHAGCAARLLEESGARLIAHREAVLPLARGRHEAGPKPLNTCTRILLGTYGWFHDYSFPPVRIRAQDVVITGDDSSVLKGIGIPGEILCTPGHSRDSISVVLEDHRAYVGDAAMDLLNICGCRRRPIFVEDREQVFASWKKLKTEGARTIFPAHGDPFPVEDLDRTEQETLSSRPSRGAPAPRRSSPGTERSWAT
jgi:hydroxyacylglutathione hydrolase